MFNRRLLTIVFVLVIAGTSTTFAQNTDSSRVTMVPCTTPNCVQTASTTATRKRHVGNRGSSASASAAAAAAPTGPSTIQYFNQDGYGEEIKKSIDEFHGDTNYHFTKVEANQDKEFEMVRQGFVAVTGNQQTQIKNDFGYATTAHNDAVAIKSEVGKLVLPTRISAGANVATAIFSGLSFFLNRGNGGCDSCSGTVLPPNPYSPSGPRQHGPCTNAGVRVC